MSGEITPAGSGGNGSPNLETPAASLASGGGNGSPNLETPAARLAGGGGNGSSLTEMTRRHLHERVEKTEEQILKIEATVFQVANYNLVFQGVILAAITNGGGGGGGGGGFRCSLFPLPFSLSAIGSILNFLILWMNAAKYMAALEELDKRSLVLEKHKHPTLDTEGIENLNRRNKERRHRILVLSFSLFCLFAALNLIATCMIPCWKRR